MTDEKKQEQNKQQQTPEPKSKKGGAMKFIMFTLVGILVIGGASIGTLYFLREAPQEAEADDGASTEHESTRKLVPSTKTHANTSTKLTGDSIPSADDQSVLEVIEDNLAFLDYKPSESELETTPGGMSSEDSLEQMNWLEKEKRRLTEQERELNAREKELTRLDEKVSKQIARIEQATSARISGLAKLYDNMEPRAVAALMANLDDATVVSILPRMKTKNASLVLAMFPSKRAARLSKQMITIAEK